MRVSPAIQRHLLDSLIGILLLVAVYYALAQLSDQGSAALVTVIASNTVPLIAVAILLAFAIARHRPGFAIAPVLFVALWMNAAIAQRLIIQFHDDPQLADRSVPADLRDLKVLVVEESQVCCNYVKMIADTGVREYVQLTKSGRTTTLTAYRIARGDACQFDDFRKAVELAKVGRTEECIVTEKPAEVPDGLLLRVVQMPWRSGWYACCDEGLFVVRANGAERVAAIWRHGRRRVLGFVPFGFDFQTPPIGLWDFKLGGPFHTIHVGGPPFNVSAMIAAAYGVNLNEPIRPARIDAAELKRRAVALLDSPDFARRVASVDLALQMQKTGPVDDEVIRLVVRLIGNEATIQSKLQQFVAQLNADQQRRFMDLLFGRLEDPNDGIAAEFGASSLSSIGPRSVIDAYQQRAEDLFVHRRDLWRWQYQFALNLVRNSLLARRREFSADQRRLLESLRDDTTAAFVARALAFTSVFTERTDEERLLFAERLDLVPDRILDAYVRQAGWYRRYGEAQISEATQTFRRLARERVARAQDQQVRNNARSWPDN